MDAQHIDAIIDGKAAEIEALDEAILMEVVGVAMAVDKLRESLNKVRSHLDAREFEKASQVGYRDLAEQFVYVQSRNYPRRWSQGTRNWNRVHTVHLNPDQAKINHDPTQEATNQDKITA